VESELPPAVPKREDIDLDVLPGVQASGGEIRKSASAAATSPAEGGEARVDGRSNPRDGTGIPEARNASRSRTN